MIAEPQAPLPGEVGNSDALRAIAATLDACAAEVQYRTRRASDALASARTEPAELAAWAACEEADRMDNVLAELQEAPLAFWRVYVNRSPWELLSLPAEAIEAYTCAEWLHGTREEEAV